MKLVYGSFESPNEANKFYDDEMSKNSSTDKKDDNSKNVTNSQTTNAGQTGSEKQKIEDNTQTSNTTGTSGSKNTPSKPIGGNTLNDVLYEANRVGNNYEIKFNTVTGKSSPSPSGIEISSGYIRFAEGGTYSIKDKNDKVIITGHYYGFNQGPNQKLTLNQTFPTKTYTAQSFTTLMNQL
jgi:hypothetical protein